MEPLHDNVIMQWLRSFAADHPLGPPSLLCQKSRRLSQHAGEPSCCFGAGLNPEGDAIPAMSDPSCGTEEAPFQAVMVFSDPVDWYRDLQLITDVVMSGQLLQSQVSTKHMM